jgi:hypothetical protein
VKPTQTLVIQIGNELGKPLLLLGIYIDVEFYISGQHRYGFRFGPTDHNGRLRITYSDVETKRAIEAKIFLMDYNTPLDDCDDCLKVKIPSADELKKAYEWNTKWFADKASEDAKGWLNAANGKIKANETSVKLHGIETIVSVPCSVV